MAQYLVLIYNDEAAMDEAREEDSRAVTVAHQRFAAEHRAALRGGNALERSSTATSVRPDGAGGFTVTDAPFAETKEGLGGYYLIEAADLDEAVAVAKQVPTIGGGVEVRPVRVVG
ncbi:YciI family protein [Actinomycetospora sp. NBRC 106378]|uniref:YciI family protein n=1 Tax=Actinomycetospora sp. NBRC 106378 TaxID=3032208 RepID=UPI0024A148C2|nr:YciI family protein [Actinomycetospora sp. NBRC 106378]GLZ51653.1 transcription initiation protein [Actinomycetospora sp. NBRC 106378]